MTNLDRLTAEIMELPAKEQLEIADKIYASLDDDGTFSSPDIEAAWIKEIERRQADLDAGRTHTIPGEEVFRAIRERHRKPKA